MTTMNTMNTLERLATCIADNAISKSKSLDTVTMGPLAQRVDPSVHVTLWKHFTKRLSSPEVILVMLRSTAGWTGRVELTYMNEMDHPDKRGVYRVRHIEGTTSAGRTFLTKLGACVVHLINQPILERHYLKVYKWQLKQWGAKAMAHPRGARAQANMSNTLKEMATM